MDLSHVFVALSCRRYVVSESGESFTIDWTTTQRLTISVSTIPLGEEEAGIDDVDHMDDLRRCVQMQPRGHEDRVKIAAALLLASFYFELDAVPLLETGQYKCLGSIRCRNEGKAVINALHGLLGLQLEFYTGTASLGKVSAKDLCEACQLYRKKITIRVRRLEDQASVYVKFGTERRKISGFPHSMLWFIQQQQLDTVFGCRTHDSLTRPLCQVCTMQQSPVLGQKRKSERLTPRKRLRLGQVRRTIDATTSNVGHEAD